MKLIYMATTLHLMSELNGHEFIEKILSNSVTKQAEKTQYILLKNKCPKNEQK